MAKQKVKDGDEVVAIVTINRDPVQFKITKNMLRDFLQDQVAEYYEYEIEDLVKKDDMWYETEVKVL